jgi:hypothetical protein
MKPYEGMTIDIASLTDSLELELWGLISVAFSIMAAISSVAVAILWFWGGA